MFCISATSTVCWIRKQEADVEVKAGRGGIERGRAVVKFHVGWGLRERKRKAGAPMVISGLCSRYRTMPRLKAGGCFRYCLTLLRVVRVKWFLYYSYYNCIIAVNRAINKLGSLVFIDNSTKGL